MPPPVLLPLHPIQRIGALSFSCPPHPEICIIGSTMRPLGPTLISSLRVALPARRDLASDTTPLSLSVSFCYQVHPVLVPTSPSPIFNTHIDCQTPVLCARALSVLSSLPGGTTRFSPPGLCPQGSAMQRRSDIDVGRSSPHGYLLSSIFQFTTVYSNGTVTSSKHSTFYFGERTQVGAR